MKITALLLCLFASASVACLGAGPEPPASNKKLPAHLRIRAFLMDEKQAISVSLAQPNADPRELLGAPNGGHPINTPYEELPPKETKLSINIGGETRDVAVKLDEGIFYTLLLYREGGRLLTPLLQDTFPGSEEPTCRVRVFNFGSNRTAHLSIGGNNTQRFPPNSFTELTLQPGGKLAINVTIPDPDGGYPALSSADLDTKSDRAVSVVIVPDYRGKFRPRIWMDGPTP